MVKKDHQFVADTLGQAGLPVSDEPSQRPALDQWGDPKADIPGWPVVDGPAQAGDVLTDANPQPRHWYFRPGQAMGIATGDGTSVGVGVDENHQIKESDWGFRNGDQPVIRRATSLLNNGAGESGGGDPPPCGPRRPQEPVPPGMCGECTPPEGSCTVPGRRWERWDPDKGWQICLPEFGLGGVCNWESKP